MKWKTVQKKFFGMKKYFGLDMWVFLCRPRDLVHWEDLFPTIISAAGGTPPEGVPGIDHLDTNARLNNKVLYGVLHATHNMTLGNTNDILQYIWCIEGKWKLIKRFHGTDLS
jgi:arylsulfatase A-like enzyme